MSNLTIISTQPQTVERSAVKLFLPSQESFNEDFSNEYLQRLPVQRKLSIGAVNDPLEYEADEVADKVMRMPEQNFIRRKCAHCEEEEEGRIQRKPLVSFIQRKLASPDADKNDALNDQINSSRGTGNRMDINTQTFMQDRFSADFSAVKIHAGNEAIQMNRELNAKAFTVGNDIYFNAGRYEPGSQEGKHLLAHELTHTIQQSGKIQREPEIVEVPAIADPADQEAWIPSGGSLIQWQNPVLSAVLFPERANALRSFLMVVKEMELNGYLGSEKPLKPAAVKLKLKEHLEALGKMDTLALEQMMLDTFTRYADTLAFPEWIQRVVLDLSGMAYKSAHGSYFDPRSLISIVASSEIGAKAGDPDRVSLMIPEAAAALEDPAMMALLPNKTKQERADRRMTHNFNKSPLTSLRKGIPKAEAGALEELITADAELWELYLQFGHLLGKFEVINVDMQHKVQSAEQSIAAMKDAFSKKTWDKVLKLMANRKTQLLKIYKMITLAKIRALNEPQALAVLSEMHDNGEIPEEAWKEIRGHSDLKLDVTSAEDIVTTRRALKGVTPDPAISVERWQQWQSFLKQWYSTGSTGWREEHRQTLSANVSTTYVCDQVGSYIQHLRKVPAEGGLRKNALNYYEAAAKAGAVDKSTGVKESAFPQGPSQPFFKLAKSIDDFPVGASVFTVDWSPLKITPEYSKLWAKQEPALKAIKRSQDRISVLEKKRRSKKEAVELTGLKANLPALIRKKEELDKQQTMQTYTPDKDKVPDNSNMISEMPEPDLALQVNGKPVTQCMTDAEWTYAYYDKVVNSKLTIRPLMRIAPNKSLNAGPVSCPADINETPDKMIVKQWRIWSHEATVLFVLPATGEVALFNTAYELDGKETQGTLGTTKRSVGSLTDGNHYVGFAPGKT